MLDRVYTKSICFNARPFLFPPLICLCFDNVLSSSVCVFSLYSPYSSFRTFFSIARARRGHLRSTQEERWRRPSSRFVFKTAPIYLLSSVFSSSSSTGYVSLLSMGVEKEPLHQRQPSSLPPSFPPPPPPPLATSLGVRWEKEEGSPKVDCCASFLIVAFR